MTTQRVLIGGGTLLALAVVAVAAYLVGVSVGGSSKEVASQTASQENTDDEKQKAAVAGVVQKIGFAQELQTLPKNYK